MNEKFIVVGGKEYILKPTFQHIQRLQNRTKERFFKLAQRFLDQDYGPEDVATILYCMIDSDLNVGIEKFMQDVFDEGFTKHVETIIEIFTEIASAGSEKTVKKKAMI